MNKKEKKFLILFFQVLIISSLIYLYKFTPQKIDKSIFIISIALSFISLFLSKLIKNENVLLNNNPFKVSNFFILSFSIVLFQIPIEFIFSSFSDSTFYNHYFYDLSLINKSIIFSSICFVSFNIGQVILDIKKKTNKPTKKHINNKRKYISPKPFFFISIILFILHIATVDSMYYRGGDVSLEGIGLVFHGYLLRFITMSVFVVIWNSKLMGVKNISLKSYLKFFPISFLAMITILIVLTFLAHDRGPSIRIILLITFGFFVISYKRINYGTFIIMIIGAGFFLSVVKLVGNIGISDDVVSNFSSSFMLAKDRLHDSERMQSISPYTFELAGSLYSNNILFYLWYQGKSFYGISILWGVLMGFPGAVSIFMNITGIPIESLNSANYATIVSGESYGVGTTIVGDALINLGFTGTIFLFLIIGIIFKKIDENLYSISPNFNLLLLGCILMSVIVALPRDSIFPYIGTFLFSLATIKVISFITR